MTFHGVGMDFFWNYTLGGIIIGGLFENEKWGGGLFSGGFIFGGAHDWKFLSRPQLSGLFDYPDMLLWSRFLMNSNNEIG